MARLFDRIRTLVRSGRYVVGIHAAERLDNAVCWSGKSLMASAKGF